MIQRINLIEKQALSFTYQRLVQICMVVVLLNALMASFHFVKVKRMNNEMDGANETLRIEGKTYSDLENEIKQSRKSTKTIKRPKVATSGQNQKFFDTLASLPKWSRLMAILTSQLPNSVWISNFKSMGVVNSNPPPKAGANNPGADQSEMEPEMLGTKIEVSGAGADIKGIAEFTAKLEKTEEFSNIVLVNTQKDVAGYQFTLQGVVGSEYVR